MKDLMLDESNDLVIDDEKGDMQTIIDKDELQQHINIMLNTFNNELSWNQPDGLNQIQMIMAAKDTDEIKSIITEYLDERLDGFDELTIDNVDFDDKSRNLSVRLTVKMTDGTTLEQQIGGD